MHPCYPGTTCPTEFPKLTNSLCCANVLTIGLVLRVAPFGSMLFNCFHPKFQQGNLGGPERSTENLVSRTQAHEVHPARLPCRSPREIFVAQKNLYPLRMVGPLQ